MTEGASDISLFSSNSSTESAALVETCPLGKWQHSQVYLVGYVDVNNQTLGKSFITKIYVPPRGFRFRTIWARDHQRAAHIDY